MRCEKWHRGKWQERNFKPIERNDERRLDMKAQKGRGCEKWNRKEWLFIAKLFQSFVDCGTGEAKDTGHDTLITTGPALGFNE